MSLEKYCRLVDLRAPGFLGTVGERLGRGIVDDCLRREAEARHRAEHSRLPPEKGHSQLSGGKVCPSTAIRDGASDQPSRWIWSFADVATYSRSAPTVPSGITEIGVWLQ